MWNDLFDLRPTNKEVAFGILAVFVLLLVAGFAGYLLGWERAEDVYCNGSGIGTVSNELGQAGTNISNAEAGISNAEEHAGNIEAGIGNAQESVEYLQGTVSTSTELIAESKRIIEAIRKRREADKTTH